MQAEDAIVDQGDGDPFNIAAPLNGVYLSSQCLVSGSRCAECYCTW